MDDGSPAMRVRIDQTSVALLRSTHAEHTALRQRVALLSHSLETLGQAVPPAIAGGKHSPPGGLAQTSHGGGPKPPVAWSSDTATSVEGHYSSASAPPRPPPTSTRSTHAARPPVHPSRPARSLASKAHPLLAKGQEARLRRKTGSLLRRLARDLYKLWQGTLNKADLQRAQLAYQLALEHPSNTNSAALWFDVARMYGSFRAFGGCVQLLVRIVTDFPKFERMSRVLFMAALVYRRMKLWDHCVTYLL